MQGENNFTRELRVYPSPGPGAPGIHGDRGVRDAFQAADSGQTRFVRQNIVGAGGFSFSVAYPAKDALDSYASRDEIQAILWSLQAGGSPGNISRMRTVNWSWRRDLVFTPSN